MNVPEPAFDESRFKPRAEAEADETIDLYEHDDPGPRYKRILLRLLARCAEREASEP